MNVGDLFLRILADAGASFKADLVKQTQAAGDEAGKQAGTTFGTRFGDAIKANAAKIALGAGALFAVAEKGAVDMEAAVAKFRAETGASEEDSKAAINAANELSKTNLQTFGQIVDTQIEVQKNLGVTGDKATAATAAILKFSTATGTDAVSNVKAFDDVLDSWGKTADDLPGIMDQIVASNQHFGGSVEETMAALAAGAPVVKAYGGSIDDTMGIINLAKASGIDATDVFKGFNAALTKVPPGTSLNDIVKRISSIADDGQRADAAIDLFGLKAGAKLANALKPGINGLGDFEVSAQDAQNATENAADAVANTLPNKIKQGLDAALAQVRTFGAGFGPALTGAASLASVGAAFASALKIDDALKGAWGKAAANQDVQKAASAAGGVLSKLFVIGATVGLAAALGDAWIQALQDAKARLETDPGSSGTGQFGPRSMWAGAKVAAQKAAAEIGTAALESFNRAWDAAIASGKTPDAALLIAKFAAGLDNLEHDTSFAKRGFGAGGDWGATFADGVVHGVQSPDRSDDIATALVGKHGPARGTFYDAGSSSAQTLLSGWFSGDFNAGGVAAGTGLGDGLVIGLKSTKSDVASEMADLKDALLHPLRGIKTVAKVEGALTSKELARGLASSDPETQHKAQQIKADLIAKLRALQDAGYNIGKKGMKLLGEGITDGTGSETGPASTANRQVLTTLGATAGYYDGGHGIGTAWADGLADAIRSGVARAEDALRGYHGPMIGESPPKTGPLKHIDKGGYNVGRAWSDSLGDGVAAGRIRLDAILGQIRAAVGGGLGLSPLSFGVTGVSDLSGGIASMLSPLSFQVAGSIEPFDAGGMLTIHHTVHVDGALSPAAAGELGREMGKSLSENTFTNGLRRAFPVNR